MNYIKISDNIFVVKNQNGFNNSIYEFMYGPNYDNDYFYTKKELRQMVRDYPRHYPSLVAFENIPEIAKINVNVLGENEIVKILEYFDEFKKRI